jgi:hemolysin activation/secretion protein
MRISGDCLSVLLLLVGSHALPLAAAEATNNFDVFEYRVLGNTVLDARKIEAAVYPFLGENASLEKVEQARAALEQAYRAQGYGTVYVDIPEQSVDSGVVRLKVTEGKLRRVAVEGLKYFSGRGILAQLPEAATGTTPSLQRLQAELATVNSRTPDMQITPVLAAGAVPGTVDLRLQAVDELPLHGSVEVNDRYTANTSRLRTTLAIGYDNLFNRLDSLGLQYQLSPQSTDELGVLAVSYTMRLSELDRLSFLYVNSDSSVAALSGVSVLGKGSIYSARWQRTLANSAAATHVLGLGIEYKDFRETIQLDADEDFSTPIDYLNLTAGYNGAWRRPGATWQLGTTLNAGARPLGNSDQEFADKRFKGRPNYFYLRTDAAVTFRLPRRFSARLALGGQYAVEALIGNEQFASGGVDSVRGYLEAEELGDRGLRGSLQLAFAPWQGTRGMTLQIFTFADAARTWSVSPLPEEAAFADLASWGAGMAFALKDHLAADLLWARPLTSGTSTLRDESRLHFSLRSSW